MSNFIDNFSQLFLDVNIRYNKLIIQKNIYKIKFSKIIYFIKILNTRKFIE